MRTNQTFRNNSEKNFPLPGTVCLIALLLAFIKTSIDGSSKFFSQKNSLFGVFLIILVLIWGNFPFIRKVFYTKYKLNGLRKKNDQKYIYISKNKKIEITKFDDQSLKSMRKIDDNGTIQQRSQVDQYQTVTQNPQDFSQQSMLNRNTFNNQDLNQNGHAQYNYSNFEQNNFNQSFGNQNTQMHNNEMINENNQQSFYQSELNNQNLGVNKNMGLKKLNQQSLKTFRKQGQKQKQSEDQNLGQSQSNRVRKISCSPSANVTNTYLQNHSQSFNYQTSRQSYTNFSQAKSQLNNISYVDQFNYTEKESFKKFFENFNKMQPNLNQFNSYLKNEISVYRNKILERIYTQQRKNLHQIDDCLSQFNFNLMEFDMLNKALSEDGKFQQNYYMNPKNQQLRLDDILYDQTYLIQSLEKQIKNIGQLNQFNEKTLNDNLSQLMEYLYERKKYLDNQLVIFGYEENGRTQFRLHNIIRLGLISFNPSLYKYNDHLQLDLKITPPTDNQILISVVTHYFNGLINEIFQNLLASVTRQQRQFRSRAKYPIDKLDEALNSIKGYCVKYLPHHLSQQNQGSDVQSNQFQENRMIQDPIYFVQKNPAGSDLQMDVYSNKQRFVAIPGQYNLNCCLYYYSICVLEKLKFINQEYMNMGDDLRKIQEYNLFLSQIHEFSDKFSNYTSNVFKMN